MNPDQFFRSRDQRYKIGELIEKGTPLHEAENIVMQGDSNKTRQIRKWKEKQLYPYGQNDAPGDENTEYIFQQHAAPQPAEKIFKQTSFEIPISNESDTLNRYLENLSAEDVLKLTAQKFGIDPSAIESTTPRLRRSMDTTKPVSVRLSKQLIERVNDKLKAENKSLSGVVESLLFQWVGSPRDMIDERKNLKQKMKLLLELINQGEAEGKRTC